MFFIALATDYDGTLAHDGTVAAETIEALKRFKTTGRKLLLVTGRELPDIKRVFPPLSLFDSVVAENGGLIYIPETEEERLLAPEPHAALLARLQSKKVTPLSIGRSIIATWHPNEDVVLDAIRDLGLELQIIFNKGAVMVLPPNVNKASGLSAALDGLGLSPFNVIGCGDAENDHAFLRMCGCSVAVANALPELKKDADIVTVGDHGAGVAEVIDKLIEDETANLLSSVHHLRVAFGRDERGNEIVLSPLGGSVLIAGASGGGKSTLATTIFESLAEYGFQVCVLDPEGDYTAFDDCVIQGNEKYAPHISEILDLMRRPQGSVIVNLLALDMDERPRFFMDLLREILNMRAHTGRPHWLLIDEAHHMLDAARDLSSASLPQALDAAIFVTVDPSALSRHALELVETVLVVGNGAADTIGHFCDILDEPHPLIPGTTLREDQALMWTRGSNSVVHIVSPKPTRLAHRRHTRKYAEGSLGDDKNFYFKGPAGALNLRAQNLMIFLQIAEGVDDATWQHHLHAHDYSRWCRNAIGDDQLADEVADVESAADLPPHETKALIKEFMQRRYTAPARADR
jgi:HAD superfamily hydrolase (TIGR01484 family)